MFWLDRNRGQPATGGSASSDANDSQQREAADERSASGRRPPAPHVVISGRQLREEILSYGPAFLEPYRYSEPDAFRALVTVLAAYALGSRTAARLVRERQTADPQWQPPSRREAMQVVSSLNRLRQYLPYLLGQRIQAAASSGTHSQPPAYHPSSVPPPHQAYASTFSSQQPQQYSTSSPTDAAPARQAYHSQHPQPVQQAYHPQQNQPVQQAYHPQQNQPIQQAYHPQQNQPVQQAYHPQSAQTLPYQNAQSSVNYRPADSGMHTPHPNIRTATPARIKRSVVNARPAGPRTSGVVVRPVISLNRRH